MTSMQSAELTRITTGIEVDKWAQSAASTMEVFKYLTASLLHCQYDENCRDEQSCHALFHASVGQWTSYQTSSLAELYCTVG